MDSQLSLVLHTRAAGDVHLVEQASAPGGYVRKDSKLRVPDQGDFIQILHAHELPPDVAVENRAYTYAVPEFVDKKWGLLTAYQGKTYDYLTFPKAWQFWLRDWLDWQSQRVLPAGKIEGTYKIPGNARTFYEATPGTVMWLYVEVLKAHVGWTDAGSREAGARDFVVGCNLENKRDYEVLARPTAGNVFRRLRKRGRYEVLEALDITKDPPSIDYVAQRPWLYYWATAASGMKGRDGEPQKVERFPHTANANKVHGLPPAGLAMPLISLGGEIEIERWACRDVVNGQRWSPYVY